MEHYQLNVPSTLIYSQDNKKIIDKIINLSRNYKNPVVVCCSENVDSYSTTLPTKNIIGVASKNSLEDYSKNLFTSLRKASSLTPYMILIEGIDEKEGLGIAIRNRLENICTNQLLLDNM